MSHSHELEECNQEVIASVSTKPPSNLSGTKTHLTHLTLLSKIGIRRQRTLTRQQDSEGLTLRLRDKKLLWLLEHPWEALGTLGTVWIMA